jgi:hypothetical protein
MMKISIEDHGKVYVYELPDERDTEDITMLVGRLGPRDEAAELPRRPASCVHPPRMR